MSALTELFLDAFGPRITQDAPPDCYIRMGIENNQSDVSDVVEIVQSLGQRDALVQRLQRQHPANKGHQRQYDERAWDVMREAVALAWTSSAWGLAAPRFTDDDGTPDIVLPERAWVEVKTIHESAVWTDFVHEAIEHDTTAAQLLQNPQLMPTQVLKKLQAATMDAWKKFDRSGALPRHLVWISVDLESGPLAPERGSATLVQHAQRLAGQISAELIIVDGFAWQRPFAHLRPLD